MEVCAAALAGLGERQGLEGGLVGCWDDSGRYMSLQSPGCGGDPILRHQIGVDEVSIPALRPWPDSRVIWAPGYCRVRWGKRSCMPTSLK